MEAAAAFLDAMNASMSESDSEAEPYPLSCLLIPPVGLEVEAVEFVRDREGLRILAKALLTERVKAVGLFSAGFAYFLLEWQTSRPLDRS